MDTVHTETLSWKEHWVLQKKGQRGVVCHPAQLRFCSRIDGLLFWPFGLARMDNGEIAMAGIRRPASGPPWIEQAYIAFSSDEGATWSDYIEIVGCTGRPMMLVYLGGGKLTFTSGWSETDHYRYFSHDYGRTWPERIPVQKAPDGSAFGTEGNALAERDEKGIVTRLAETGQTFADGPWPKNPTREYLRWSRDGGRTWENTSSPPEWRYEETWAGQKYLRGASEGALVRAANGWLVAALRTDMPPKYFDQPHTDDSLEGTGVSISKDDGKTWSPLRNLFTAGRHHANLLRMPNGNLVMTLIRRVDIRDGKLAGYRRGCDAVVSRDNGQTWDIDRMYVLDDFAYLKGENWVDPMCGHLYSILLDDGSILTGYGNYLVGGILIRWKP
jgi:hypothetical protein